LISMRTGVYALIAVILGVMLVGILPGEISNLSVPRIETMKTEVAGKGLISPTNVSPGNSNVTISSTVTVKPFPTTTGDATNQTQGSKLAVPNIPGDPYADIEYYGLWSIGFVVALVVYFIAKRMLS
jgi:hypothetical protein